MKRNMRIMAILAIMVAFLTIAGCPATTGTTNTTATNVGVTAYEGAGVALSTAYNTEKALLAAGKVTPAQDAAFQLGPYTKAVDCYKAIGTAAVMVLTATDASTKANYQAKFDALNAQLPGLLVEVTKFISDISK
jgi:hypothetical protein